MRPLLFTLGLALGAGAEAHADLAPLIVQSATAAALIIAALVGRDPLSN
jgi:hypothetical protein